MVHGHVNVVTRATEAEALSKLFSRAEHTRARIQARREVYDFTLLPRRCIVKMYYGRACIERGLISCLHLIVPVLEQRLRVVLLTATPPRRRCAPPVGLLHLSRIYPARICVISSPLRHSRFFLLPLLPKMLINAPSAHNAWPVIRCRCERVEPCLG